MDILRWTTLCPAKINLFLSVGPKDGRGWHPLRTIFQAVSIYDTLQVQLADRDGFSSNADYLPEENTLTVVLRELRKHCSIPPIQISLIKRIPAQSGMGGGSSDAAGLARIVPHLIKTAPPTEKVLLAALATGADVPFFLVGGAAAGEGYGERLTPLPDAEELHLVVVKPEVDCPTPAMFRALDELHYPWEEFPSQRKIYNDFERVMPEQCRRRIETLLTFGATEAGLSGSGSAVFGLFENRTLATTAAELVKNTGQEHVWACRSLTRAESLQVEAED